MKTRWLAAAGFGAFALGIATTTAQAAPVVDLGAIKAHAGAIEKVTWGWHRRCHWHNGYRTCGWGRHWHRYHHHSWGWRRDWHYHHRYW